MKVPWYTKIVWWCLNKALGINPRTCWRHAASKEKVPNERVWEAIDGEDWLGD